MKNTNLLLAIVLFLHLLAYSQTADIQTAKQLARSFYMERHPSQLSHDEVSVLSVTEIKDGVNTLLYICTINEGGFVVIAGDYRVLPVLAYSFENDFNNENMPPAFRMWIDYYQNQIASIINDKILTDRHPLWDEYLNKTQNSSHKTIINQVEPLIYSNWNQDWPYNELCPSDPQGPGGHCYAGCVPTAMGMLMYYYRWPLTGTGSYSFTDPNYGLLSANFGETSYPWEEMTFSISKTDSAMAKLLYHLGVSCDLVYGPDGSGMYNHKSAYSLRTFFKYSPETQYVYRDSTNMNWDSILIAHLERKMPMYYAGWSVPDINGHAFICDGYQSGNYFHFNFGWGGSSNGYFYTGSLNPGGNNFNLAQEVIINCYPDTVLYNYPQYCQGSQTIKTLYGSVEDGSGPNKKYTSGTNCQWLIDPQTEYDSVSFIKLIFHRINTNTSDIIKIYDGDNINSTLLGSFSGNTLPGIINSSGNKVLITFSASGVNEGFLATYEAVNPVWCSGTGILTEVNGDITDGSGSFWYNNSSLCIWRIQPPGAEQIALFFDEFDTESGKDKVRVYDMVSGALLADYSGNYPAGSPPPPVVSLSGKMMLSFNSNMSVRSQGWKARYESYMVGMNSNEPQTNCYLYPNPSSNITRLHTGMDHPALLVEIYNLNGQLKQNQHIPSGEQITELSLIGLPTGMYFVKIHGFSSPIQLKLIKY